MARVIGVRFRTAGKIYFFSPGKFDVKRGNQVIVETARGIEFGNVVTGPKDVPDDQIMQPLKDGDPYRDRRRPPNGRKEQRKRKRSISNLS